MAAIPIEQNSFELSTAISGSIQAKDLVASGDIKIKAPGAKGHRGRKRLSGGYLPMHKNEIIFFDELGFGWVVDKIIIQSIHERSSNKEIIVEKTLADLLRRPG